MTTAVSAAFGAPKRRKPTTTYGKKARPAPALAWDDDAPELEPSPKQTTKSPKKLTSPRKNAPKPSTAARDILDLSSDDEIQPPPTPVRAKKLPAKLPAKLPPKQPSPPDEFDVPSSPDEAIPPPRRTAKVLQSSRNSGTAQRPASGLQALRKAETVERTSSEDPIQPTRRRARTPQIVAKATYSGKGEVQAAKVSPVKPKAQPRAPPPAPAIAHKKLKGALNLPKKSTAKPPPELDIYDVPTEEDVPTVTPRRRKPAPLSRTKSPAVSRASTARPSPDRIESDDSNVSRKRKRQESTHSSTAAKGIDPTNKTEDSSEPRSRKYPKKATSVSPGYPAGGALQPAKDSKRGKLDPSGDKPKQTRLRSAPGPARASIAKGQSSPAKLHGMLAMRSAPRSPILEQAEDETMYDLTEPATPVSRSSRCAPESVTPRQKKTLGSLMGDSTDSTQSGMPSIRRLQLSDRKQGSLVGGLVRSSSDIPQSTHTRRTRLVDTLMQAAPSSEEDETESDEEAEEEMVQIPAKSKTKSEATFSKSGAGVDGMDDMDIDAEAPRPSQASQGVLNANSGLKVIYDQQRTYREDSNLEDALLFGMDMDMDEPSHNRKDSLSEDDDPTSQVRGYHELRRQGENQEFQMEAQTSIDDIANKAGLGTSVRRSAMLDFCTSMADKTFMSSLLDSALGHQFLANIGFTGEVIFDFAACVAVAFMLDAQPDTTVLDEIYKADIMISLTKLLDLDTDILRIAKERKTNLSKVGRESVESFRAVVHASSIWSSEKPDKVTPQIVALRTLELLVLSLRKAGSTEALLDEKAVGKLLDVAAKPCERLRVGKETSQDALILHLSFSIMEALSISREKHATWSNKTLQRLADTTAILLTAKGASPIKLAIRLCILLTNNKPKACEAFAGPNFVTPLVSFISHSFTRLASQSPDEGSELREDLILSLGAMINISEFSDRARESVLAEGEELVDSLTKTFLEGSERAAQADSVEEIQANIPVGYLTVLLGNLCAHTDVRHQICQRLPEQRIRLLVVKLQEFVSFHQRADQLATEFQGKEGREVSQNYTRRLMQVVERLEQMASES